MRIFHGVVADDRRPGGARAVVRDLGGSGPVVVSTDIAAERLGPTANHRRVLSLLWATYDRWLDGSRVPEQEVDAWLTVLEDDVVLCDDFRTREFGALSTLDGLASPAVVSWYLGTGRWAGQPTQSQAVHVASVMEAASGSGAQWLHEQDLWHGVAYSIPVSVASSLLSFPPIPGRSVEETITAWARDSDVPVLYSHPSLADHRDGARLIASGSRDTEDVQRRAWVFAGRHGWRPPGPLHRPPAA